MKKVIITTSSFGKESSAPLLALKNVGLTVELNPYRRRLREAEVLDLVEKHDPIGIIAGLEPLTRAVLKKGINLKVVSRCGIGLDSVDLSAAKEIGISITNTPDAPTIPVSELTVGMIISLLRKIHISDASIRRGEWGRPMGNLLHTKTVGIIGCGRIGSYLGRLLASFGCTLLGYDPIRHKSDIIKFVSLENLLSNSDIISLHIPYNDANHHFINANHFDRMKEGAFFINAARGGLVDESALYEALSTGHLGGAALDCYEEEPYNGKLKGLSNTLLTAHIGSYAKEGRAIMEMQAAQNLIHQLQEGGYLEISA